MINVKENVKVTDAELEKLWDELTDIPMSENTNGELVLEEDWHVFPKGTEREEIWHWFDMTHTKGVGWLMENI